MVRALAKVKSVGKFLIDRARGIEYGGVKFGTGKVKLVRSDKLHKLDMNLDRAVGEYASKLNTEKYNNIMRRVTPLANNANHALPVHANPSQLEYLNVHGGMQVWDNMAGKPVVDICERLQSPILTYLKNLA